MSAEFAVLIAPEQALTQNITIILEGARSRARVIGCAIADYTTIQNFSVLIEHQGIATQSLITMYAIARGSSSIDINALIRINLGAKGSNARCELKTMLLSALAKAKPVPSFEIAESDVKASHAATITRVREDELFYLQTRGIDTNQAQETIISGFLNSISEKFGSSVLREEFIKKLPSSNAAP